MSFSQQRMSNLFPAWAKIRKDPSSFGNNFFSSLAGFSDNTTKELVKLSEMLKLFAEDVGFMTLQEIYLEEADHMKTEVTGNGFKATVTYPTVVGGHPDGDITVRRAKNIADFFYSMPERITLGDSITVDNWTIWESSSPETYNSIDANINGTPERLLIRVYGSTFYKRRKSKRSVDKPFYGSHFIHLTGRDEDNNQIREYIPVTDDGYYHPTNIYRSLSSVEWEGFDGSIKITLTGKDYGAAESGRILYRYDTGVTQTISGPLALYLKNESTVAHLNSTAVRYIRGAAHRRAEVVDLDENIEEDLGSQRLLDVDGNTYTAIGMAINPVDTRLHILDNKGIVHVYEPCLSPFKQQGAAPSDDCYVDVLSIKDRVVLNERIPLWTWFRALVLPVQKVVIKRVKPDGVEEWLQPTTLTWSTSSAYFSGNIIQGRLPEDSWKDFRFYTTFDQLGQWDFYCETTFLGIKETTSVTKTAVMCERLKSKKDFSTNTLGNADGIFFDKENFLCISEGNKYHRYSLNNDCYLADVQQQRLLFRELYTEVDISYV